MQCPICQKEVSPQASYCLHCGASLNPASGAGFSPVAGASSAPEMASPQQPSYAPVGGYTPPASGLPPSANYGASAGSYPPPPGYPPQPAAYPPQGGYPSASGSAGLSNNAASAIAYLTIIPAILFLVMEPYNRVPLVRFHSFQSIGLFVAAVILQIGISIAQIVLRFIPLSWMLFTMIHLLLSLGVFIVWLIVILKASKGEWYKLPVIGDFAEKQARS